MTDLDPRTHARRTDPTTSHAAARGDVKARVTLMRTLLRTFFYRGPLTCEEAAKATGIEAYAASKRISDLTRKGWIEETGQIRTAQSGKGQRVHDITAEGRRELGMPVR